MCLIAIDGFQSPDQWPVELHVDGTEIAQESVDGSTLPLETYDPLDVVHHLALALPDLLDEFCEGNTV